MVTLTDIAAKKVSEFLSTQEQPEAGLRVAVKGGGCSGFQYQLALDERHDGDEVFDFDGIRILVDEASLRYVDGSTVDYTEWLMGAGFQVNNPNVVAACGRGSSLRGGGAGAAPVPAWRTTTRPAASRRPRPRLAAVPPRPGPSGSATALSANQAE